VTRRATRVAWSLLAAFAVIVAALVALAVANGTFAFESLGDTVALLLAFGAFMVVGTLVVAHRPGNAVGWVFTAIALLAVTGALGEEYARYAAATRPGSLPGAVWAAWYASWTWYPTLALVVVFTPLLFPTGRLPSSRWRLVAWPAVAVTAAITLLAAVQRTVELAPAAWSRTRSGWRGSRTPRTAGSAPCCSPCSAPWCWPRSPRWWSGSGARGATNASS
jgi:hypothetical protein